MQAWYFKEIEHFEPVRGYSTKFAIEYNGKTFTHLWTVRHVSPQKSLTLGWQYAEYPGDSEAIFSIEPAPEGSLLTLTANILDPFPDIVEFSRESMLAGWTELLRTRLKNYLATR